MPSDGHTREQVQQAARLAALKAGPQRSPSLPPHQRRLAPDAPRPVFVRAFEYPLGYAGYAHRHRLAQIVYPLRGVVSVRAASGTWVTTRLTAVAIPPWEEHRVAAHGNASLRSVFID